MKYLLVPLVPIVCALTAASAHAQYPDRPIKLIVPWAAGGDTDNIFRPFTPLMQKHIGQTVVIANVGGASGTVGVSNQYGTNRYGQFNFHAPSSIVSFTPVNAG